MKSTKGALKFEENVLGSNMEQSLFWRFWNLSECIQGAPENVLRTFSTSK
jgi:hypothetical protein